MLSIGNIKLNNNPVPKTDNEQKYFWNVGNFSNLINIIFDSNAKCTDHFCNVLSKANNCIYTRLECKNFSYKSSNLLQLDNSNDDILNLYKIHGQSDGHNFTTQHNLEFANLNNFFTSLKSYDVKQ
jgi:hypothetical protein